MLPYDFMLWHNLFVYELKRRYRLVLDLNILFTVVVVFDDEICDKVLSKVEKSCKEYIFLFYI